MSPTGTRVLVVGAGPVGLSLGCELLLHGLPCRVIDVLDAPVVYSKAAAVHARTMEVLETIGVSSAIAERSKVIYGVSAYSEGKRIVHVLLDEIDSPFPHVYGISQRETEEILTRRLQELGGTVERSLRLESFTQDDDGVTAKLVAAKGGVEETRVRWLVGCDGAHSAVRHGLEVGFEGGPYEERIDQTDAHVQWPRHVEEDEILAFLAEDGPLACFPFFQDGRYRILKMYTSHVPDEEPTLATFQRMMEEQLPGARVSDPAWITSFRIHHRLADRFRVGRVFLAGDAAHIHSPAGGQGMNTGIQDAHNLGWKIALVERGIAHASLLASYAAERRPVAEQLLLGTDLATRAIEQAVKFRSPLALGLRNGFMSLVTRLDFVRANLTRTLSMVDRNYRSSPIVSQDRAPLLSANVLSGTRSEHPSIAAWAAFSKGPEPGDRAPDVAFRAQEPKRLFSLLDARKHTLLLFDGGAQTEAGYRNLADIAGAVRERVGDAVSTHMIVPGDRVPESVRFEGSVVLDPVMALHDRYGARSECLYLIRPDGHVAYRSQPASGEGLARYLETIFLPQTR